MATTSDTAATVREAFVVALDLPADADVGALELGRSTEWDSIAHMTLVAEIEERCGVAIETDDLVNMSSFQATLDILKRYGVDV